MPLNRIYQGRVSAVELDRSAKKNAPDWKPTSGNDESLWQHHALFQDAINYYLVGLLALASRDNLILGPLLAELAKPDSPRQIWNSFVRRGQKRPGLSASVAPYLTPGNNSPTMAEAFAAILAGNEAKLETRDAAVTQLLQACDGAGAIQQEGRGYWPKFCDPDSTANFAGDPVMYRRSLHQVLLPQTLHDSATVWDSSVLDDFDVYSIATPDARKPSLVGADAIKRLSQAVQLWRERRPELAMDFDRLAAILIKLPIETSLQGYVGSSAKGEVQARLFALLIFRHIERSPFTFDLLKSAFPQPKAIAEFTLVPPTEDPVRVSRGARGFVFPAFTSLPCWKDGDGARPTWKAFDIAAFKYALTAVNQVEEKTKERNDKIAALKADLAHMHGQKRKISSAASGEDDAESLPVLVGDSRIPLLRAVVAGLKVDTALTDGDAVAYGLQRRTVRGFRDLRRLWRSHAPAGTLFSSDLQEKLRADLRQFQTDNSTTIGSEALFSALLDKDNWSIWQEPDADTAQAWASAGFAENPLDALVHETELNEDIERLREPVKLTPAHPEHSRRQYDFNAVSKFGDGARAAHRHEPGHCAFTTEVAAQEAGLWRPVRARIVYSAPRLLRDGLRREDNGERLAAASWLQPMMEALAPLPELPQDLTDMPVMLMPDTTASGQRRVLLNLPVTLEPEKLVAQLGKRDAWLGQFCGTYDEPFALRWPADGEGKAPKGKTLVPWFQSRERFTVLGVDLGTRDAGALAHLTVTDGAPVKSVSRVIGEAGGKPWNASLTDMQLIKLPGEDASVFVHGVKQTELYGEKGRMPSLREQDETREIIVALGQKPEDYLREDAGRLSFPEINDQLLRALRRAQGRLARLQSWSWKFRKPDEAAPAREDLLGSGDPLAASLPTDNEAAASLIDGELLAHRERVVRALVQIANRVVSLRGRHWTWKARTDVPSCHILGQTDPGSDHEKRLLAGQRGISHQRIEQLEELRHRCQSLNCALQHKPGEKPRMGRRTKGDELPDPCPDLLKKMERLREQRVDQTAHAILAAALGVRLRAPAKDRAERVKRDIHGEYERFRDPVDFIAIENLSRYLSSQDRARSENSRLMQWCHRQLVQKLRQLCESYGIPVLAAPAAYSSRFSSRDGSAGFRAVEVSAADRGQWPWRQDLARLAQDEAGVKKLEPHARKATEQVRRLFDQLDAAESERAATPDGKKGPPRTLFAPIAGGPIFIPLGDAPPMQADINAAANIALRAIASPDRHDIHQRIRTERKGRGGQLQLRRDSLREKARWPGAAPVLDLPESDTADDRQPNLFTDVAGVSFANQRTRIEGLALDFATGKTLWTAVKTKAWDRVARLNEARLRKWREKPDAPVPGHPEL
ncbi:MAG: type V CRISPR-associated protein Cas12b [Opitutaceae bacterium]|jgi:hypothetical protein